MEFEFPLKFFESYSYIKFNGNPSSESRVGPSGRTDGQTQRLDENNSRFSKFFEPA